MNFHLPILTFFFPYRHPYQHTYHNSYHHLYRPPLQPLLLLLPRRPYRQLCHQTYHHLYYHLYHRLYHHSYHSSPLRPTSDSPHGRERPESRCEISASKIAQQLVEFAGNAGRPPPAIPQQPRRRLPHERGRTALPPTVATLQL